MITSLVALLQNVTNNIQTCSKKRLLNIFTLTHVVFLTYHIDISNDLKHQKVKNLKNQALKQLEISLQCIGHMYAEIIKNKTCISTSSC